MLLGEQELDARVEFRSFGFQESDDSVVPVPFPDESSWGSSFSSMSAGSTCSAPAIHTRPR